MEEEIIKLLEEIKEEIKINNALIASTGFANKNRIPEKYQAFFK